MSPALLLVYKIGRALQNKFADKLIVIRRYELTSGRFAVEYVLADGDREGATGYSEAFFEDDSKAHVNWLATVIYKELMQRLAWSRMSIKNPVTLIKEKKRATHPSNAGSADETIRPREQPKVPPTRKRETGRGTGSKARFDVIPQDVSYTE